MQIEFSLDGEERSYMVDERISALRLIRETCGRMDIVSGCAPQGICGTCMVLINGKPRLLCTLRAKNLHGKNVETLASSTMESLATQIASFSSCAATPCGYCTPALMLKAQSIAGYSLTAAQEKKALQMHLCRCASWTRITKAMTEESQGATPYGGAQQLRMLGKNKNIVDMRTDEMIFARPMFAPSSRFLISEVSSQYSYLQTEKQETENAGDICALIYGKEAWYRQELGSVFGKPLPLGSPSKTTHVYGEKKEEASIESSIEIPFVDPGYFEPEAVFVDWDNQKTFVSGQDPHELAKHALLEHPIYSVAGSANFGGHTVPSLVEWAHRLAEKEKVSVLLALHLEDAFRVRPKRPAQKITASISPSGTSLYVSAEMSVGHRVDVEAQRLWRLSYSKPYHWDSTGIEVSCISSHLPSTSLQRGLSLEGYTAARECALDRFALEQGMDPFSIRASLLSPKNAKRLWDAHDVYLSLKKEGKTVGIAIASTPLGLGKEESAEASIFVRSAGSVEIHTGFWDSQVHRQMIALVHQKTGLPKSVLSVVCGTEFPAESGPSIAGRDRWLGMQAVSKAAEKFRTVAVVLPELSLFVGQVFTGKTVYTPSEENLIAGWSFAVAMVSLSEEGAVEDLRLSVDIGSEQNEVWAKSHIEGTAQQAFSLFTGEGFVYDKEGLPPSLLQKMGISKARHSPYIEAHIERSDSCTAFGDASFCAAYAALCVAKQRRQT